MTTLIIPIAGKSSRFPNVKPKWMLTHPKAGNFMVVEAISGLNLNIFEKIYFVCLEEHEIKYQFTQGLFEQLENLKIKNKSEIVYLTSETKSQSETVAQAIKIKNISGFIFIKDSDNYFEATVNPAANQVCYFDLNNTEFINPKNKSYIALENNNYITNIVEKKIISSTFSVGGYGFVDAQEFLTTFNKLKHHPGECFVSNIIFDKLLLKETFVGIPTKNFKDWGTLKDWNNYKKTYHTLFIDLDGTLITNSSHQMPPYIGQGLPLMENITFLRQLKEKERTQIIITTSRPEKYRNQTEKELNAHHIPYDLLIMGLQHCQRIVINDYAATNPYPSCSSINIQRNEDSLKDYFNL